MGIPPKWDDSWEIPEVICLNGQELVRACKMLHSNIFWNLGEDNF